MTHPIENVNVEDSELENSGSERPELEDSELENSGLEKPDLEDSELSVGKSVLRRIGMEVSRVSGPPWLAISDKVTPDHISTILGHFGKSQEIDLEKSKLARLERIMYVFLGVAILVCMTLFIFPENQEIYLQILEWAGLFFAGGFGGYGIGVRRSSRSRSSDG